MRLKFPEFVYTVYDEVQRFRHLVPFLGYPFCRENQRYQPFFIVGSGRSGTTLLRRILYAHPAVHIPPETYVVPGTIRSFRRNRRLEWSDLVHLIVAQFEFYRQFGTFETSLRPVVEALVEIPEDQRSLAVILDRIYRYHAEAKGKKCERWGDKTPINTFAMERIHRVFPDARFVNLIRDAGDVVASCLAVGRYNTVEAAAARWSTAIQAASAFAARHPESCLEVRYERLVRDPENTVSDICSFLGLDLRPEMLASESLAGEMGDVPRHAQHAGVYRPISGDYIGQGRRKLTSEQRQTLDRLIGPEMRALGYGRSDVG